MLVPLFAPAVMPSMPSAHECRTPSSVMRAAEAGDPPGVVFVHIVERTATVFLWLLAEEDGVALDGDEVVVVGTAATARRATIVTFANGCALAARATLESRRLESLVDDAYRRSAVGAYDFDD